MGSTVISLFKNKQWTIFIQQRSVMFFDFINSKTTFKKAKGVISGLTLKEFSKLISISLAIILFLESRKLNKYEG